MSLLNPVLLPPKVKAYLSQGERFIKWDDVSGALGWWGPALRGFGGDWFMSARVVSVWHGQAADRTAWQGYVPLNTHPRDSWG